MVVGFAIIGLACGAFFVLSDSYLSRLGFANHLALTISWSAGLGSLGASAGGLLTLALGRSLSRLLFVPFIASVVWLFAFLSLLLPEAIYASRGIVVDIAYVYSGPLGIGAIIVGIFVGLSAGRRSPGFRLQSRFPLFVSACATMCIFGICCFIVAELKHSGGMPWQILVVCAMAGMAATEIVCILTVVYLAVRSEPRGFPI